MNTSQKWILVVGGPTAVGKTDFCIQLAQHFKTDILSADSRQFYRETNLGTAKPSAEERAAAKHHFIDSLSIHDSYDVGKFEQEALQLLGSLFKEHQVVVIAGGSGMYIQALCHGLDEMPEVDTDVREELMQQLHQEGIGTLQEELRLADPEYYQQVDLQNPQRIVRALEVCKSSGLPYSSFRKQTKAERPFKIIKVCLNRNREELYSRIDERMDSMIAQGLFEEAEALYPHKHLNALQTVGYTEVFGFMDGKYDREEAIRLLKRNSRRYAKRQLTWFRKDPEFRWFHPSDFHEVKNWVEELIKEDNKLA